MEVQIDRQETRMRLKSDINQNADHEIQNVVVENENEKY